MLSSECVHLSCAAGERERAAHDQFSTPDSHPHRQQGSSDHCPEGELSLDTQYAQNTCLALAVGARPTAPLPIAMLHDADADADQADQSGLPGIAHNSSKADPGLAITVITRHQNRLALHVMLLTHNAATLLLAYSSWSGCKPCQSHSLGSTDSVTLHADRCRWWQ